ncbi:MAG: HAD family hydrolase [Phycisphaerae bacterium]|jgi:phosphoglycolate phosphatase
MSPTAKPPKLCIFDLDGTLVDSLRDIADALNECLDLLGLPTRPLEQYRYMVGEGVPTLCRRAIGDTHPLLVARLAELARARYRAYPLVHTKPYPGVVELVGALRRSGVRLGVLSNKPHELTTRVVRAFWTEDAFEAVQGYVDEQHRKPDPHYVRAMCEQLGVSPAQTCLVGDTPTDVETARRAGARCLAITWGFRTRDDLLAAGATEIVDRPDEALQALLGQRCA